MPDHKADTNDHLGHFVCKGIENMSQLRNQLEPARDKAVQNVRYSGYRQHRCRINIGIHYPGKKEDNKNGDQYDPENGEKVRCSQTSDGSEEVEPHKIEFSLVTHKLTILSVAILLASADQRCPDYTP